MRAVELHSAERHQRSKRGATAAAAASVAGKGCERSDGDAAEGAPARLQVHFLMYEDSTEEQKFLSKLQAGSSRKAVTKQSQSSRKAVAKQSECTLLWSFPLRRESTRYRNAAACLRASEPPGTASRAVFVL